jgi:hypothetical protein
MLYPRAQLVCNDTIIEIVLHVLRLGGTSCTLDRGLAWAKYAHAILYAEGLRHVPEGYI